MLGGVRSSATMQGFLAAALCIAAVGCGKPETDLSVHRKGNSHGCALSAGCSGGDGDGWSDLQVTLTAEGYVLPADTIHYQAVVTNFGTAPATAVHLEIVRPDGTISPFDLPSLTEGNRRRLRMSGREVS